MKNPLSCFLSLIFLLSAYGKKLEIVNRQSTPGSNNSAPATGSLSGIISPAHVITGETPTVLNKPGSVYHIKSAPTTGAFNSEKLAEGSYLSTFTTTSNYITIPSEMKYISAGKKTDLGTTSPTQANNWLSCKLNGTFFNWQYKAEYINPHLHIKTTSVSSYPEDQCIGDIFFTG